MGDGVRIAMWSGPRNISTAMMRSWGSRGDTAVVDEPLYSHYLRVTGLVHPGRDEVLASQSSDWREVVDGLLGPVPGGKKIWYQKHMAHHLTEEMGDGAWVDGLVNCLLIRDPAEMITSFVKVVESPTAEELGLPQQVRLFDRIVAQTGRAPVVVDSRDVLEDPEGMLRALCERVGVGFDPAMLSWDAGARETDGVWGKYWYGSVWESTGFGAYRAKNEVVPSRLSGVLAECRGLYERLWSARVTV